VTVDARQKDYFDYVEVIEEKSKEGSEIIRTFNSLSKTNLRGTFYTIDGVHVPYRYMGGDIAQLFVAFFAREPLRREAASSMKTMGCLALSRCKKLNFAACVL
jgi:hypothetical protein